MNSKLSPRHRYLSPFRTSTLAALIVACLLTACVSTNYQTVSSGNATPVPDYLNDPNEPINRGVWQINKALLTGVVHPTAKIYRAAIPQRVRGSIRDFGRNITYPGRLVNHMLQGRWEGAGNETLRFVSNTTVGIGGFFDPATKWNIEKSDANFSQTFGTWGWQPKSFIVLPFLGPSDDRHATGYVADKLAEPLNYYSPYDTIYPVTTYNNISEITEEAKRVIELEPDSYAFSKYAWTYGSKEKLPDLGVYGPIDVPTLQTLGAVKYGPKNLKFLTKSRQLAVRMPTTRRKLKITYWMQPEPAPVVYLSPGLISHRLSLMSLGVAEQLYHQGFSVVNTTSVFHPEFMESASTAEMPVYPPVDSRDLLVALTEIDRTLMAEYPDQLQKRALVGLSMGGFMVLKIAVNESQTKPELMTFDRYVAINMPVDVRYGVEQIDSFMNAPLEWPEAQRQEKINNTMHKASYALLAPDKDQKQVYFDEIESKYLIGLSFRIGLRDMLFSSQIRNDRGLLESPLSKWNREPVYRELLNYSFRDYFLKFAVPYYQEKGIGMDELLEEANLRAHESKLRKLSRARIIVNENDFLLQPKDVAWLRSTFSKSQLTVFPQGGHLGNLEDPAVQKAIAESMTGLH